MLFVTCKSGGGTEEKLRCCSAVFTFVVELRPPKNKNNTKPSMHRTKLRTVSNVAENWRKRKERRTLDGSKKIASNLLPINQNCDNKNIFFSRTAKKITRYRYYFIYIPRCINSFSFAVFSLLFFVRRCRWIQKTRAYNNYWLICGCQVGVKIICLRFAFMAMRTSRPAGR